MAYLWDRDRKYRCVECKMRVHAALLPSQTRNKHHSDFPEKCPWCSHSGNYLEPQDGVDRMNLETARPKTLEELLTPLDRGFLKSLCIRL